MCIRDRSMMIQIPVENAVKHALREKEGERNLWVSVCRRGNGICIKTVSYTHLIPASNKSPKKTPTTGVNE